MKLSGSRAVVTGGASGLGEATVRAFVAEGARVTIFDLNEERAAGVVQELGESVSFVRCDVSHDGDVESAISQAQTAMGGIDVCVNCAGIAFGIKTLGKDGPHSMEKFRKVIDINLIGTFNILRLASAAMADNEPNEEGERGVIINTASVAAFEGQKGQVAYSATKGAIAGMTLPISRDLAYYGIRCCAIAPGLFLTPLFEGLGPEVCDSLAKDVPFPRRLGRPAEYAALAKTIVENAYLNGTNLRLDGAVRLP